MSTNGEAFQFTFIFPNKWITPHIIHTVGSNYGTDEYVDGHNNAQTLHTMHTTDWKFSIKHQY